MKFRRPRDRIVDSMAKKTMTILFVDLQGYFPRIDNMSRTDNPTLPKELKSTIDLNAEKHNGTFLKTMNNGVYLAFESPTDGVRCGKDILTQIERRNDSPTKQNEATRFRIGISTGEVNLGLDGNVHGDALNRATRLQNFADPNNVYISESTYLAMDRTGIHTESIGQDTDQTQVYKLLKNSSTGPHPFQKKSVLPMIFLFIALVNVLTITTVLIIMVQQKPDIDELMAKGDYRGVLERAPELIAKAPENLHYHDLVIQSHVKLEQYEEAGAYLKGVLESVPESGALCNSTVGLLVAGGRYQQASEFLDNYCEGFTAGLDLGSVPGAVAGQTASP